MTGEWCMGDSFIVGLGTLRGGMELLKVELQLHSRKGFYYESCLV